MKRYLRNLKRGSRITWSDTAEVIGKSLPRESLNCIETTGFRETYPEATNIKTRHNAISFDLPETDEHILMTLLPGCCKHVSNFDRTYDKYKHLGRKAAVEIARHKAKPHTGVGIVADVSRMAKPTTPEQKAQNAARAQRYRDRHPDRGEGRRKGRMF